MMNDADIQMAQLNQVARNIDRFEAGGGCAHGHRRYVPGQPLYGDQRECVRCGKVGTDAELDADFFDQQ